jgi:plastocyanin
LTADNTAQAPNKGVALVAKGIQIGFSAAVGLHTITINGEKQGADFKAGDTRQITFNTTGEFKITCDYHPDMFATVFVQ